VASISSVVSVNIRANSRNPTRAGFGTPLIYTYHTVFAEKWRVYTSLAGMIADGFTVTSSAYRLAQALTNQNPSVKSWVVGRKDTAPTFSQVLAITSAVEGAHVRFKVIDSAGVVQQVDYTIGAAATTSSVATAVELLVEALAGVDSAASAADITVTSSVAGFKPYIYDLENCGVHETTADAGYDTELAAFELLNNAWYFVLADSQSPANVAKIAAYVLPRTKLYFVATQSNLELAGTGTLGSDLKALANGRTVLIYGFNPHEFSGAAWVGVGAPQTPGEITWANKQLTGVTAKDLTSTQQTNLETDNINHYQEIAGLGATRNGVVTSGEWIDVVHGTDALTAAIQEAVWTVMANAGKIPFTDAGLDLIASAILGAMKRFEGNAERPGLLLPGSSKVSMPLAADISASDKRLRRLTGVAFYAKFAGAVHAVDLVGTLEY